MKTLAISTGRNLGKRWAMCESKHRYADKKAAVSAVNFAMKFRRNHGRAESLRYYSCPYCRGWHLTKENTDA